MLFPNDDGLICHENETFKRLNVEFKDQADKYMFKVNNDYTKQFAHIYASRLAQMRELLTIKVKEKWGERYPIKRMFELREDNPEECIIIGTLFKHQQLKPSILREISEEMQLAPQPVRSNYVEDSDKLILEDELQRIRLVGKIDVHSVVTGIVCAVLGYVEGDGKFIVEDFLFYESGSQAPLEELLSSPLLVLISGLNQSAPNDFTLSLELLQQWIYGNLEGFDQKADWEAANIVRVIVAGNSVRSSCELKQKSNFTRQPESAATLKSVNSVDEILSGWVKSVNVDLMSGEFDPSNYMLPQQPMHHCLFPKSVLSQNFRGTTNPYECEIANRLILGTSGQNINDIMKFSKIDDPLEALKQCVIWSHISPTSPDTLPCFPYYEKDPFIIDRCPHVMFAGNMSEFKTTLFTDLNGKKVRLVCIPDFSKTQSVAVVNLKTLDCKMISFKVDDDNGKMDE